MIPQTLQDFDTVLAGNNTLILNEATMIRIMQVWLGASFKLNCPQVKYVKQVDDTFIIKLESPSVQTQS